MSKKIKQFLDSIDKVKEESEALIEENAKLKSLLSEQQEIAKVRDVNTEQRLNDLRESHNRVVAEKDEAFKRLISEKDEAHNRVIKEKDESHVRVIAEKDASYNKLLQEKEKAFEAAITTLKEQFAHLAAEKMKEQGEGLAKHNRESIDVLLTPVRDQVKVLQELTEKSRQTSQRLGETMTKDVGDIGQIAKGLQGVANALYSNTRYQGRSGEDILAEKLRQAGLEENVNFFLQRGNATDRPDAQVCDPENRWLIIDSKVSLTAYLEYADATDKATREEKLRLHVASVKQKIDQLAKKKYPIAFASEYKDRNYLPVTAMFVPYEAPLMEALRAEPSLWQYASEQNVMLITPLTLLAYLRLVFLAWQHEKEARNQQEIVETARELLARMNTFLEGFEGIGDAITKLSDSYDKAKNIIVDAPRNHTIAKAANRLIALNVRLEGRKGKKLVKAACLTQLEDDLPLDTLGTEI